MKTSAFRVIGLLAALTGGGTALAMTVWVSSFTETTVPIGTPITWSANAEMDASSVSYRFRVRRPGAEFRMLRDYGPLSSLDWTPSDYDGTYEMEVTARNNDTGDTETAISTYTFAPLVSDGNPVINSTTNPLVFIYSAPPCPVGSRMRVQFSPAFSHATNVVATPWKQCADSATMNFYLAGLRPESTYQVWHAIQNDGGVVNSPALALYTPAVALPLAAYTVLQPAPVNAPKSVLLQSTLFQWTVATDLDGAVIWYYPGNVSFITRPQQGGRFFGIVEDAFADPSGEVLREFDLAGVTVRETNAARINEQLAALGVRPITGFHHEARQTPNGGVLVLASTEQILTDVQGPGDVDVIGDMILVLDRDLQVTWAWDAFDHLDVHRMAVLKETCTPQGGGCPPFHLAPRANDWLHGNSVQLTEDGNLLYSARHQDWVMKIDYAWGQGTGNVLWRLGKDGDFQIIAKDPYPWFSHQHDPQFLSDGHTFTVFDNGNTRVANGGKNSRGQVLYVNERIRYAQLMVNADLGAFSFALGSAQWLPGGTYHFELGWVPAADGAPTAQSVEVDFAGNLVYSIQVGTAEYRSFRMRDLYTP